MAGYNLLFNGEYINLSAFAGYGLGSGPSEQYQTVSNNYYKIDDQSFHYLKRYTNFHTLKLHKEAPYIDNRNNVDTPRNFYNVSGIELAQPVFSDCYPFSASGNPTYITVGTGWYIINRTLYDQYGQVRYSNLPRIIAVELAGGGGGGGAVYHFEDGMGKAGQGGGAGGYGLVYIDTTYNVWHFRKGTYGSGGAYSKGTCNDGGAGGDTGIWNNTVTSSQDSWSSYDSDHPFICFGGLGGKAFGEYDDGSGISNYGSVTNSRGFQGLIYAGYAQVIYMKNGTSGKCYRDNVDVNPDIFPDSWEMSPMKTFTGYQLPGLGYNSLPSDYVMETWGFATGHGGSNVLSYGECNQWIKCHHVNLSNSYYIAATQISYPNGINENNTGRGGKGGFSRPNTPATEGKYQSGYSGDGGRLYLKW